MKRFLLFLALAVMLLALAGCGHEHSYTDQVVPANCTDGGYTVHTCPECGNSYRDGETPAAGHRYENEVTEPTCTVGGYTTHTCTVCGYSLRDQEKQPTGHSYREETVAPTCTENGYKLHTCTVCGESYRDGETALLGHTFEDEAAVVEPTCTEEGYTARTCAVCGDEVRDAKVPPLGHAFEDKEIAPTCKEGGYTTHTCTVCGTVKQDTWVPATGHKYKDEVTEPTCKEGGYTTHTCIFCGESYRDHETKPGSHQWNDKGACVFCGELVSVKVVAVNVWINSADGVKPTIYWRNNSGKTIKYVTFTATPYNAVDDRVSSEIGGTCTMRLEVTGPIKPLKEESTSELRYYNKKNEGFYTVSKKGSTYYNYSGDHKLTKAEQETLCIASYWDPVWYNGTVRYVLISRIEIEYMDGTKETISSPATHMCMYESKLWK